MKTALVCHRREHTGDEDLEKVGLNHLTVYTKTESLRLFIVQFYFKVGSNEIVISKSKTI